MQLATLYTRALNGINAAEVTVEAIILICINYLNLLPH